MNLFKELKRRNVFRIAGIYAVVAWILMQVAGTLEASLKLPEWFDSVITSALIIGFPIALLLAWAFEMTPEGMRRTEELKEGETTSSSKLDGLILVGIVTVIGLGAWQQFGDTGMDSRLRGNDVESSGNNTIIAKPSVIKNNTIIPAQAGIQSLDAKTNNKSIAVLPFTNMANNPESEPITVGLHDDLLTHISKISALKVISRTSVLEYKGTTKKIKQIAKELGVANILEGGVQKSGNQIRINVQLINAQTDNHIWAEVYDRELTANNIFKIQTEISNKIAAALKAELTPAELKNAEHPDTNNLDAYNAYLAGRQRILSRNSIALKQALTLFQKATALDSNYALAYVAQADTLRLLNEYSDLKYSDMLEKGEPLVAKALALQPELAEAHTSKADYLNERGKIKKAEESFLYSLSLNPNYTSTYHWYGVMLRNNTNRYQEALKLHRKAAELDPLSPILQANVAWSLFSTGQIEKAESQFHLVLELAPNFTQALFGLSQIELNKRHVDEAIIWMRKAIIADPGNIQSRFILIDLYITIGDLPEAKSELIQSKKIIPQHAGYIWMEVVLDLLSGNKKKAQEQTLLAENNLPSNRWSKKQRAKIFMIQEHYDEVIKICLSLYPNKDKTGFELKANNLKMAIYLVWSLQQSGQTKKADQLITEIIDLMKNISERDIGWANFSLLAIQGKQEAAAKNYAQFIKRGSIGGWFIIDQLPYLTLMRKQPEYIQAHQELMEMLKLQREHLAKLDAEGQTK